jgi:hypothetical protein
MQGNVFYDKKQSWELPAIRFIMLAASTSGKNIVFPKTSHCIDLKQALLKCREPPSPIPNMINGTKNRQTLIVRKFQYLCLKIKLYKYGKEEIQEQAKRLRPEKGRGGATSQ